MRSEGSFISSPASWRVRRGARGVFARQRVVLVAFLALTLPVPAAPQREFHDEPLLASAISEQDIELRGRYVHQWTEDDGTLVLLFSGGFRLDMGPRRMSASNAVVWIAVGGTDQGGRRFHELTVYLSENAEVREPGGTVTLDTVLLIRGVRTYGQIIKLHDAHAPEGREDSPLYQQALQDRAAIERGEVSPRGIAPEVKRPIEVRAPRSARPSRVIRYGVPNIEPARTPDGQQVFVMTGGVYFSQAGGRTAAVLEIRADNAVVFPASEGGAGFFGRELQGEDRGQTPPEDQPAGEEPESDEPAPEKLGTGPPTTEDEPEPEERAAAPPEAAAVLGLGTSGSQEEVRAVYLEGDVVLSLGHRFVRAARLYYDFERDRALILDAVFRADIPEREIPLYVRAAEIRQLSASEFSAEDAVVTTSEFYTPSYHVGAERIKIRDLTARDSEGQAAGAIRGEYEMKNTTLNVEGVPFLWWPYSKGTLEASETLIRRMRTGYSSDRGAELETSWYLFNLLGIRPPEGLDATLDLDYFSDRGPGLGVNADYEREDQYGLFRGYFLHDEGRDTLGPLRRAEEELTTHERGRVLWRHRHFLPYDWEATVEVAYLSDPNFLEEWERSEFHEGKEQETLIYLKRARDTEAITLLANWCLLDFVTQTEHLPELAYRRIGDTFLDPIILYHESRVGSVRKRVAGVDADGLPFWLYEQQYTGLPGRRGRATGVTFRGDIRQEAELPLKLGPFNLVPFASVRGTYWDNQPLDEGGLWRGLGVYGARGGISFSRVYDDIESELLDIHRIRHIIKPDFAAWWAHSNTRSELITPFDYGIETIDGFHGFTAGVRQTWQTKRGAADQRRTVDLLTLNLEVGIFGNTDGRRDISNGYADPLRPENSRTRNYFAGDLIYRLSDTTSLLYDFNIDLNDWAYDRHNVSLAVERSPRLAYVFGSRYAGDIDMSLVGGGWNYRLNEKHITATRAWFDVDSGELGEIAVVYIRKLPRWYVGLSFEYDNIDDEFTVSVSLWPEGIPEWTLGSRRFTGLATSTGIRP